MFLIRKVRSIQQALQNIGMKTAEVKGLRQGKYFEIEINENNEE